MSTQTTHHVDHTGASYEKGKLFVLSVIALVTAGMVFSIRAEIIPELKNTFFMPTNAAHAAELIGSVAGVAFLAFAVSIFIGSPLCDYLGMGRLMALSCLLFIVGSLTTIFAAQLSSTLPVYWVLWFGMATVGLAHGLVEAVINPLVATLYPDDKTHKLNVLHAWWPGGLMIGGLLSFGLNSLGAGFQVKLATILVPAIVFGLMLIGTRFPPTERVAAGVSSKAMIGEAYRPMFIVLFLAMFLTAASELAPNQWVGDMLSKTLGFNGILVLVYVSMLMFVMRHFAGPIAHKLSPIGLLWTSCLLASAGLLLLSYADNPVTGILAATVWGTGVCYMWPTMLGVTSELFPRGGAFLLGIMGSAGNLSIYFVLPAMGRIYDHYSQIKAQEMFSTSVKALAAQAEARAPGAVDQMNAVFKAAAPYAFRWVAILPAILLVVFGVWWLADRARGGYRAERLETGAN